MAGFAALLTPEGRSTLGVAPSSLRPDGHELAQKLLRPLAEGRGRLSREDVAANLARASEPGRRSEVERLMQDKVQLLGGIPPQPLGHPYDWYHAPGGDYQWPTHLSRHYYLLPLAYAYRATNKRDYADRVVAVLLDWVVRNPLGDPKMSNKNGNWSRRYADTGKEPTTLEGTFKNYNDGPWTALSAHARLDTWTELFQYLWDAPVMDNRAVATLLNSLMGDHRRLMLDYPRQMNQYQAIASSLVWMGMCYPDFAGTAEAEHYGWERLTQHTRREVYPDGSFAECSPNYDGGMMARLREIIVEGQKRKRKVPPLLRERLGGATRYFALTSDPEGHSPRIAKGGGDVLSLTKRLNTLVGDPEVAFVISKGKEGKKPESPSATFPWAGHHVFRSGWDDKATWLFFDAGLRGTGHHDIAQNGIQLFANGEWLLTDPGFYSYSGEGAEGRMSKYLHSTAAHNDALVDGEGQISAPPGAGWAANTAPGDYHWSDAGGITVALGTYIYGFGDEGRIKVTHRRKVTYDHAADTFTIEDTFGGTGSHTIDLHWQLDPAARVTLGTGSATIGRERTRLEMAFTRGDGGDLGITQVTGQKEPLRGWFSAAYGKLAPAPLVRVSTKGTLPMTITTRLHIVRT